MKDPADAAPSESTSVSLDQILNGGYDQIILPALQAIFGQTTSDRNPIVGTTGQTESFILDSTTTLLNSLDVRGDVDFVLAEGLDPSEPVLIYILTDLNLANGVTLSTAHNMTLRASRVYGDLRVVGTAGQRGRNGTSFSAPAADGDPGIDRSNERGPAGRDAEEPIPPFDSGHSSLPGGKGPDGGRGGDGAHGQNGGDGAHGQDGNDIKLWVERFEDGGLFIDINGGDAGAGGSGQDGGDGGAGGNAGQGGQGGSSAIIRSASDGGVGGNGGDGGDGGNGGRAGLNGRPGNSGACTAWGPRHQNAKPPRRIAVNASAGRPPQRRPRHGNEGRGGNGGSEGSGGPGGTGRLLNSNGNKGPDGRPGVAGRDGSAYTIPIPTFEGNSTSPNIDFSRHPSAELSFLTPFISTTPIAFAPKSTVIDDWGEQAYFEGMQLGSLGPDYRFNGGRSVVTWSDASDLVIAGAGLDIRGLYLGGYKYDPAPRWLELEIFCPTLVIKFDVTSGARLRIEKGRFDTATGQTAWDPTPLVNLNRFSRTPTLPPFSQTKLGTCNRLRLMGEEVYLHSLLVADCSECRSLPDC